MGGLLSAALESVFTCYLREHAASYFVRIVGYLAAFGIAAAANWFGPLGFRCKRKDAALRGRGRWPVLYCAWLHLNPPTLSRLTYNAQPPCYSSIKILPTHTTLPPGERCWASL
eukprot:GHVT01016777.1.p1 GENE.GHVT01016777.1~~GHVT01016777.1.p1  ORF type:complete len:114 (+),score=4.60 GHVT01016777.1:1523-1864(+)